MKAKKIPLRKCLGCNESKPKRELIRLVRGPEGEISLDFTGKKNGRGAYVCISLPCFEKAKKAKRFERAFSAPISEEIFLRIEEELKAHGG